MFDPKDKANKHIIKFFDSKRVLVVDASKTVRTTFKKLMADFTIQGANIFIADNISDGKELIVKEKPHFVFVNHSIQKRSGLELLEPHLEEFPNRLKASFYLLSDENSLAVASVVLETEVDAFFCQPFTIQTLQDAILNSIKHKIRPSSYTQNIEGGKELLFIKEVDQASELFSAAKEKDKAPAEACFYLGLVNSEQDKDQEAEELFEEGLFHMPTHFRCLKSLADMYMEKKEYQKAYDVNTKLTQNYPVNPNRLPDLIKLSIINGKYEDVINFCDIFQKIPEADKGIQKFISAGLAICGKFLIDLGEKKKAKDVLNDSARLAGGKKEILKSIISTLMNAGEVKLAMKILEEFTDDSTSENDFKLMELEILSKSSRDSNKILALASELMLKKVKEPLVYHAAIERSIKVGRKKETVEEIVFEAIKIFPDMKKEFDKYLK